ncbi:MAG: adenosylcobinamide-GDP ribazoletransferase [Sporomusaceae bacterium]|nr:adenosylcobinamide-GDP ribazoletransferase [Sporomusaceae bacterium]
MVKQWFSDFITGFQFLTRIQLLSHHDSSLESFGRSVRYFPLIGAFIGVLLAFLLVAARWGFGGFGPQLSLIACLIIGEVVITGALHWDGFMDTFDGVFSGRERERMLEIMKDSRVGAFGALALALALLARFSFLYDLDPFVLPLALIAMPTTGRLGIVFTITFFPYARPSGLGQVFPSHRQNRNLYIALVFFALVFAFLGVKCLLTALGGLAIGLLFAAYVNLCLGGVTGDVYGAVSVVTELAVLFCFLCFY